MQLVVWQEIDSMETDAALKRLTLHRDAARTSGVHLSLRPVRADRRPLLAKAVEGRLKAAKAV
jgi:hypothetical protein